MLLGVAETAESDVYALVEKSVRVGACMCRNRRWGGRDRHGPTLGSSNLSKEIRCLKEPSSEQGDTATPGEIWSEAEKQDSRSLRWRGATPCERGSSPTPCTDKRAAFLGGQRPGLTRGLWLQGQPPLR